MGWEEDLAKLKGADLRSLSAPAPKEERGDFSRGFETSMRQIPQTIGGALGLAGDITGLDGVRDFGMGVYHKQQEKIQALSKDSDSFSNVLEGNGDAVDFLQYGTGYVGGQALSALATGGLGGLLGKEIVRRKLSKEITEQAAKKAMGKGALIGATGATAGLNFTQEAGSIYPEAVEHAEKMGLTLDAGDKARIVGSAFAAAAVDTAMQYSLAKGVGLLGKDGKEVAKGAADGLGKRVAKQVPAGMAKEGVTEGIQTVIERYGAGKELDSAEATREYVDSMALGALGGGLIGAATSLRSQKEPEIGALTTARNAGIEAQAVELEKKAADVEIAAQSPHLRAELQPLIDDVKEKAGFKSVGDPDANRQAAVKGLKDFYVKVDKATLLDSDKAVILQGIAGALNPDVPERIRDQGIKAAQAAAAGYEAFSLPSEQKSATPTLIEPKTGAVAPIEAVEPEAIAAPTVPLDEAVDTAPKRAKPKKEIAPLVAPDESTIAKIHQDNDKAVKSIKTFGKPNRKFEQANPDDEPAGFTAVVPEQEAPEIKPIEINPVGRLDGGKDLGMQNRDRSRPASIQQMNQIASKPDYDRLSVGRSPNEAAPMVAVVANKADVIPDSDKGKQDRVTLGDGSKVDVRYAVVEADSVLASHNADGSANNAYFEDTPSGSIKALNNGRIAGLREAYKRGTVDEYRKALEADADRHGISAESIRGKKQPVLVRVYDDKENDRPNMGALSNPDSNLGMAASENALNDSRLLQIDDLVVDEDKGFLPANNVDVMSRFALAVQAQGGDSANVKDRQGKFTPDFERRFKAAVFAKAYRDQSLVEAVTDDSDPDFRNILHALAIAAPAFAKIEDAGKLEVRPNIVDAVGVIRDARSRGLNQREFMEQMDVFGRDPFTDELVRFMWNNVRSAKRIGYGLQALARAIDGELVNRQNMSMFDDEPASRDQIVERVNKVIQDEYGEETAGIETEGQAYRPSSGQRADSPDGGGGQQSQSERTEAEALLKPYTPDELRERAKKAAQLAKQEQETPPADDFVLSGSSRFVDELEARGQQALFEARNESFDKSIARLLSAFAKKVGANPAAKSAVQGSLQSVASAIRKGSVLASLFGDSLAKVERADIVGSTVRSPADLAFVAQALRDPRFETFRWVFIKNGTVAGMTAVSSRLASSANTFVGKTKAERSAFETRMKSYASQADGFYMLHNHPNGDPAPSQADIETTKDIASRIPGFLGHVVIDTNAYSVLGADGSAREVKQDFGAQKIERSGVFSKRIIGPQQVAELAADLKKPGWATLFAVSADLEVNGAMEVPIEALSNPSEPRIKAMISRFGRQTGAGGGVFLAGVEGDAALLSSLVEGGVVVDIVNTQGESLRAQGVIPTKNPRRFGRGSVAARLVEQRFSLDFEAQVSLLGMGSEKYTQDVLIEDEGKTVQMTSSMRDEGKELDSRSRGVAALIGCLK